MKKVSIFTALLFCLQAAIAQNSMVDGSVTTKSPSFYLDYLRDDKSADLFRPDEYAGVEGSPFFSDAWTYAKITLADNRKFDSVLLRINLYENKIHFKDEAGHEKMIAADVREVQIKDQSSKWDNIVFVSGYGENKNQFYQAITDGKKMGLLKKMNVIIKELKVFNAPNQKSFEQQERLYIYSDGRLYEESKNCSSIMNAFKNESKITRFVADNDIKCNKEKDMKKLVDYYNSY